MPRGSSYQSSSTPGDAWLENISSRSPIKSRRGKAWLYLPICLEMIERQVCPPGLLTLYYTIASHEKYIHPWERFAPWLLDVSREFSSFYPHCRHTRVNFQRRGAL